MFLLKEICNALSKKEKMKLTFNVLRVTFMNGI